MYITFVKLKLKYLKNQRIFGINKLILFYKERPDGSTNGTKNIRYHLEHSKLP